MGKVKVGRRSGPFSIPSQFSTGKGLPFVSTGSKLLKSLRDVAESEEDNVRASRPLNILS